MIYLAYAEPFMFWGGLLVLLVSLAIYAGRTGDYKSLLMFWQPTVELNRREFLINRTGMSLMIAAVAIRLIIYITH